MSATVAETTPDSVTCYRAGDLSLYPEQRTVYRGAAELALPKLTFELLQLLVESAPALVTHEQIAASLWAGRPASEDTVRQRIKLLRKALADDPANPRYVSVVRGHGIRWIPAVSVVVDVPGRPRRGVRQILPATVFVVALLACALFLFRTSSTTPQTDAAVAAKSIAVLPFESLSTDPDDAIFVDGFHNELLTHLARIDELGVISRTSVVEYRSNPKNLRHIGEELGVTHILEGTVQRSGANVRINAQLIDTNNDRHLWAEIYDRRLTPDNLFDIQSEMAGAITLALQLEISASDDVAASKAPTSNIAAYNRYLLGLHHAESGMRHEAFGLAADAFQNAVEEDPEFALAWAALARAHSAQYFFGDRTAARRDRARAALARTFALQPDLPEAYLARGYLQYHIDRDYDAALSSWQVAERGMPGDSRLQQARAIVFGRKGDVRSSLAEYARAVERDPRNVGMRVAMSWQFALAGELDSAESALRDVLAIVPDRLEPYRRLAYLPMWRNGDARGLRAALDAAPMEVRARPMEWLASMYERDFNAALALLEEWPGNGVDAPTAFRPLSWFYGTTHDLAGATGRAEPYFLEAERELERLLGVRSDDERLMVTLADVRARLGKKESALSLADRVLERIPELKDAERGGFLLLNAAWVQLAAGEVDAAIGTLDAYLSSPSVWTIDGLLPDPRLDSIREHPAFVELVGRHRDRDVRLAELR